MKEMLTELQRWEGEGEEIALATLVRVRGSAPRRPGARLGVTRSGRMLGSVSGGCVENDVIETAWRVLDSGRSALASYGIADELGFEVGLSCGGRMACAPRWRSGVPRRSVSAWRRWRCGDAGWWSSRETRSARSTQRWTPPSWPRRVSCPARTARE
ncbi:MAG: XdhC family protein [Deltaproteobacteria bacterium]|nr:XdhC family protein [Deltaproteobacteria bacterium]